MINIVSNNKLFGPALGALSVSCCKFMTMDVHGEEEGRIKGDRNGGVEVGPVEQSIFDKIYIELQDCKYLEVKNTSEDLQLT